MKSGEISLVEDAPGDVELILFGAETPSSLSRGASPRHMTWSYKGPGCYAPVLFYALWPSEFLKTPSRQPGE